MSENRSDRSMIPADLTELFDADRNRRLLHSAIPATFSVSAVESAKPDLKGKREYVEVLDQTSILLTKQNRRTT